MIFEGVCFGDYDNNTLSKKKRKKNIDLRQNCLFWREGVSVILTETPTLERQDKNLNLRPNYYIWRKGISVKIIETSSLKTGNMFIDLSRKL